MKVVQTKGICQDIEIQEKFQLNLEDLIPINNLKSLYEFIYINARNLAATILINIH
ncbi:7268_t:CDS:1, partial [Acaulospora morrowiae]